MSLTVKRTSHFLTFIFFSLVAMCAVQADPITLYTTGVDNNGNKLAAGAIDPHYKVITGTTQGNVYTYAHPAWAANGASSQWISTDPGGLAPQGQYIFRLTFTIDPNAGYDLSTAMISGAGYADDSFKISLNGKDTGIAGGTYTPGSALSFLINGGFVLGVNTIDFIVNNVPAGNTPLGLQITSLTGSISKGITPAPVPEPTTLLLFGTGLVGLATRLRKRKQN